MLEVHAILHRQRCYENMTEKTGTLSDAYAYYMKHGYTGILTLRRFSCMDKKEDWFFDIKNGDMSLF